MDQTKSTADAFVMAIETVTTRRQALLRELSELDGTLKQYGLDVSKLGSDNGNGTIRNGSSILRKPVLRQQQQRRRRPAPSVDWLEQVLHDGKMSQREVSKEALRAEVSGNAAVALLQRHQDRFKSERGPRTPGQKGMAPLVWSLR